MRERDGCQTRTHTLTSQVSRITLNVCVDSVEDCPQMLVFELWREHARLAPASSVLMLPCNNGMGCVAEELLSLLGAACSQVGQCFCVCFGVCAGTCLPCVAVGS